MSDDVNFLRQLVRESMEVQAQEAVGRSDDQEMTVMKPLQVFYSHTRLQIHGTSLKKGISMHTLRI